MIESKVYVDEREKCLKGRPKKVWKQVVERDMKETGLRLKDTVNHALWKEQLRNRYGQLLHQQGKRS